MAMIDQAQRLIVNEFVEIPLLREIGLERRIALDRPVMLAD